MSPLDYKPDVISMNFDGDVLMKNSDHLNELEASSLNYFFTAGRNMWMKCIRRNT